MRDPKILEENFKTHKALNDSAMEDIEDMKEVVEAVLIAEGYADQRAARMDINDFLCLLAAFNSKGIHFTS